MKLRFKTKEYNGTLKFINEIILLKLYVLLISSFTYLSRVIYFCYKKVLIIHGKAIQNLRYFAI